MKLPNFFSFLKPTKAMPFDAQNVKLAQTKAVTPENPMSEMPAPNPTPVAAQPPAGAVAAVVTPQAPAATFSMQDNEHVNVSVAPVDAAGNPSKSALSGVKFVSSDESILTVGADPDNANGAILIAVKAGTVELDVAASVADPDGTQGQTIGGKVAVTLTHSPAAALVIKFGTPTP